MIWDIKIILAIIATFIGIVAFFPYLKDTLNRKTKPHAYTWLIWALTQGTAVFAMLYAGGGIGAMNLAVGLFFVFAVFLFSLKYGTKVLSIP